jgi:hypothetical protein
MPDDPKLRACAVCARVLSSITDRVTDEPAAWQHPADMIINGSDDHPPVPVAFSEIQVSSRCDFCYLGECEWLVPASDFEYGYMNKLLAGVAGTDFGSHGDWSACNICAEMVNRGLWSNLARRAFDAYLTVTEISGRESSPEADAAVELNIRATYKQLRKHVTGSPKPLHPNG